MAGQHPDPTPGMNPDDIARTTFAMGRKGYDPIEVKSFLVSVSNELRAARSQVLELEQELRAAQQDADRNREVDPSRLTALLGEETARVLDAAREVADDMRAKAEEGTARLLREATDDANRMRQDASEVLTRKTAEANTQADQIRRQAAEVLTQAKADAATEVEAGRQEGREMVAEAQKVRERMLNDLARRRKAFRQQIERLQAGRDRLLAAYDVVRETLDVATDELQVALPEARLAAESASLRAGDEDVATLEELEQEAASLPESTTTDADEHVAEPEAERSAAVDDATTEGRADEPEEPSEPTDAEPAAVAEPAAEQPDEELVEEPGDVEAHDPGPRAPSAPDLEGRRSSSVNVIRSESDPDPDPDPAPDPEPEQEPEPDAATATETDTEPEQEPAVADADAPAAVEVSSLFARIRSESEIAADEKAAADAAAAEKARAEGPAEVVEVHEVETIELVEEIVVVDGEVVADTVTVEVTDVAVAVESEPVEIGIDAQVVARRDAALADTERALSRRIKRELSDEQNELLDTVRRQKGKPTAAQALPEADEHRSRYATAALPSLVSAAATGADLIVGLTEEVASKSGAPKTRGGDLAAELAADLVEGLRDRIERCFAEAGGDEEELAERLRACYREWKGQRVDELASRYVLAACNRGLLDSLAEGTLVHWVVDDGDTPSPDCDDNALAGDVHKGDKFPTGHLAPPISLTCRCIVLPAL